MRSLSVETSLSADAADVYAFLLDSRNDELWCPMVSDVELVEGAPGVGAVYRFQQSQGPGRGSFTAWQRTIVAEPHQRIEWDNADRGISYHAVVELTAHGRRTHVRHTNRVTAPNPLMQALWWSGASVVLRLQLRNLRRELER